MWFRLVKNQVMHEIDLKSHPALSPLIASLSDQADHIFDTEEGWLAISITECAIASPITS